LDDHFEQVKSLEDYQILAMCQRGFGNEIQLQSTQELGGGTLNTTYLITFGDNRKVVLRVAPLQTANTPWSEALLMRREHSIQPFLAPLAALMPKTLHIDFTHQLIDRDYMFQTYIDGERWDDVVDELSLAENDVLWQQFGNILKQLHNIHGDTFGTPAPGLQFPRWSEAVIDRLERNQQAAQEQELMATHLGRILELTQANPEWLDEIRVPCLLHGDLWLFNLLVARATADGPAIVGLLDADRAWWGDPMADWTMFILANAETEAGHTRFWQAYGERPDSRGAQVRAGIYAGMHASSALLWAAQHHDESTVARAQNTMANNMDLSGTQQE
jgi:aminoglycoside phosphotransferase (APT) family kinase protein